MSDANVHLVVMSTIHILLIFATSITLAASITGVAKYSMFSVMFDIWLLAFAIWSLGDLA